MVRFAFAFLAAALVASPGAAFAEQYEATLLPDRSLRYRSTFGLFEDDFEAFVRPRYLSRWDSARLVTHLTQLTPAGEAAAGYGNAVTDGWSWSALAGGGYGYSEIYRTNERSFATEGGSLSTRSFFAETEADGVPTGTSAAQAAFGVNRELGAGVLGLGLQARWTSRVERAVSDAPLLFTLPSPGEENVALSNSAIVDLETGTLFEANNIRRSPNTDARSLKVAFVGGYAHRKERGWGWALDILGGVDQVNRSADLEVVDRSTSPTGTSLRQYKTNSSLSALSPLAGIAVTLMRAGERPLWIDLGGEFAPGISTDAFEGETSGVRMVTVTTGGVDRRYTIREQRLDRRTGTLGQRARLTAGVRQGIAVDPLLQLGWGLHGTVQQNTADFDEVSTFAVNETLDPTGAQELNESVRSSARGESRRRVEALAQSVEVAAPIALIIRSASDAALEWRLGSEVRYRNALVRDRSTVSSVTLPSGDRIDENGARTSVRYTGAAIPTGSYAVERDVSVRTAVRAGAGYWFTPSAKIDVVLSAASSGDGFLDLDDRSLGLSAMLAF